MRFVRQQWPFASAFILICGLATAGHAEDDELMGQLRRKTPSGQYVDPASFFRFHGYISLSYTQGDDALGSTANGTTPQILISQPSPRTGNNEGGFRNDAALFVGGEPFENVGGVIEIHFVGDALDPVITEAKMSWGLVGAEDGDFTFRLTGGRYWLPFGIHNDEWFSAVNRFALISPAAAEVLPAHYNEVGLMGEGELKLTNRLGLNYALSVGNGTSGFDLPTNVRASASDANGNRTLTGRVGLVFPHGDMSFEVGLNGSFGQLRSTTLANPAVVTDYAADFSAFGADATFGLYDFGLRSYFYLSTEDLGGAAPVNELARSGFTLEPSYTLRRDDERFRQVMFLARFSQAEEETLAATTLRRNQVGLGTNIELTHSFVGKIGYIVQGEDKDLPDIDNDAFNFSFTYEF